MNQNDNFDFMSIYSFDNVFWVTDWLVNIVRKVVLTTEIRKQKKEERRQEEKRRKNKNQAECVFSI